MKTAVLLGAGSSMPAGFPSTEGLTNSMLSGAGIKRQGDGAYYLTNSDEDEQAVVQLVNRAFRHIYGGAKRYFAEWKESPPNYEHLYYLAKQLWDEEMGEMENPAIGPFAKSMVAELKPMMETASGQDVPKTLGRLYREVCNYIADTVWRNLQQEPSQTNQLKALAEACRTGRIVSISTLCHDTHVETVLRKKGIPIADGFSDIADSQNGYRYWEDNFISRKTIPFLKLHGSVDWFQFDSHSTQICIPPKGQYAQRLESEDGSHRYAFNGRPELLIGTFNKLAEYSQGISLDLYYRFRRTLNEADQLAICGYSFGDKGINTVILEWFYANPEHRRFLVIHPDPEGLIRKARVSIAKHWEKDRFDPDHVPLKEATTFIPRRLEELSPETFLAHVSGLEAGSTAK